MSGNIKLSRPKPSWGPGNLWARCSPTGTNSEASLWKLNPAVCTDKFGAKEVIRNQKNYRVFKGRWGKKAAWASRMSASLIGRKKLRRLFKLRMDYMNSGQEIGKRSYPMRQFIDKLFRWKVPKKRKRIQDFWASLGCSNGRQGHWRSCECWGQTMGLSRGVGWNRPGCEVRKHQTWPLRSRFQFGPAKCWVFDCVGLLHD